MQSPLQRSWWKQALGNSKSPQASHHQWHDEILSKEDSLTTKNECLVRGSGMRIKDACRLQAVFHARDQSLLMEFRPGGVLALVNA